jgi:hypothetical protein
VFLFRFLPSTKHTMRLHVETRCGAARRVTNKVSVEMRTDQIRSDQSGDHTVQEPNQPDTLLRRRAPAKPVPGAARTTGIPRAETAASELSPPARRHGDRPGRPRCRRGMSMCRRPRRPNPMRARRRRRNLLWFCFCSLTTI